MLDMFDSTMLRFIKNREKKLLSNQWGKNEAKGYKVSSNEESSEYFITSHNFCA